MNKIKLPPVNELEKLEEMENYFKENHPEAYKKWEEAKRLTKAKKDYRELQKKIREVQTEYKVLKLKNQNIEEDFNNLKLLLRCKYPKIWKEFIHMGSSAIEKLKGNEKI